MLDLLERHMPDATLFLAHLDRGQFIHRIVDCRNGDEFGLRSNLATPLGDAFCSHMAEDRAPRLCDELAQAAGLRPSPRCSSASSPPSYLGVPLELSDGSRVGALAALSREFCAFEPCRRAAVHDARPRARLRARAREQRARPAPLQRPAARPGARDGRRRAGGADARFRRGRARVAICEAACEVAGAPVAFLLEPSGRDFMSTAMAGPEIPPGDDPAARRPQPAAAARSPPRRPTSSPTRARTRRWRPTLVESTQRALGRVRARGARRPRGRPC